MRVLITGGLGYAGSAIAQRLSLNKRFEVTVIDNLHKRPSATLRLPGLKKFVEGDIRTAPLGKHDLIIHCAAIVGDECSIDDQLSHKVNVDGTRRVLDMAGEASVIMFSSSAVYGNMNVDSRQYFTESSPANPQCLYAEHKVLGEKSAKAAGQVILRCNHFYGLSPCGRLPEIVNEFAAAAGRAKPLSVYNADSWRAVTEIGWMARVMEVLCDRTIALGEPIEAGAWNVLNENVDKRTIGGLARKFGARVSYATRARDKVNSRVDRSKFYDEVMFGTVPRLEDEFARVVNAVRLVK